MKVKVNVRPTKAIVNLAAIAHNIRELKRHAGGNVLFMAVIKADAYGHGIVPVAKMAVASGADWLGVALLEEAVKLRRAGITSPILIFGIVPPEGGVAAVKYNISVAVCRLANVLELNKAAEEVGQKASVQIKVDTGMGRIGLQPENVLSFVESLATLKHIRIEGLFSHFSSADDKDKTYAYRQLERFKRVIASLDARGINIPIKHFAGSAATLDLPASYFDMVRPGISLYGIYPSNHVSKAIDLQPAMALKTQIIFIKDLSKGSPISYGNTYVTSKSSRIATLPIGYADGYPRLLSNQGEVLVCGRRVPVVGRVCMDMTMIDVSDAPGVEVGTEVILFGRQNGDEIFVDEIAYKAGTIAYEILCGITNRVPKVYEGK